MNFEDEPYVRVYKRKTVTTKLIGWEGRMVLRSLLLELDRAGTLDLDGMDPAEALVALDEMPLEYAKVGMARLIERGTVVVHNGVLYVPRYIEGQEARQSDAQRQRESRAKRAAGVRAKAAGVPVPTQPPPSVAPPPPAPETVTTRDPIQSQPVTESHTRSHAVTRGHPSSAQPSSTQQGRSESGAAGEPTALVLQSPAASAASPKKPQRARRFPDFQPKPQHVDLAMRIGADLEAEVEKFRDHEFRDPKSDPDACFRTWLKRSIELRRQAIAVRHSEGRAADGLARQLQRVRDLEAAEQQSSSRPALLADGKALS